MRQLASLLALVCLTATTAFAQGGFNLGESDCYSGPNTSVTNACTSNSGAALELFVSARSPIQLARLVSFEAVLSVILEGAMLPPWWQIGTGQCRSTTLSVGTDFTTGPEHCVDFWQGQAVSVVGTALGWHGPASLRILALAATQAENVLQADTEHAFARIVISRARTIGAAPCAGCTAAACIQVEEVRLNQPAGAGDVRLLDPIENRYVSYNGVVQPCPGTTPTRNRTWGAVKALYR